MIPKPGSEELRPLSIPAVVDRVVQAAVKIVILPIFEADMEPMSFGFRPGRSAHDALQVLVGESWKGNQWVVETDIARCFDDVPHDRLVKAVSLRISDGKVLQLISRFLRVGTVVEGHTVAGRTGTPHGGVLSPLLANIYLTWIDRVWDARRWGVLVRNADDVAVMFRSGRQAQTALATLHRLFGKVGLRLKESKTRIVELCVGGEGFDFFFHHRLVRSGGRVSRKRVVFLARWPSAKAMRAARDTLREWTSGPYYAWDVRDVVARVNRFLAGWVGYFRYGNSARAFSALEFFAYQRVERLLRRKLDRSLGYARSVLFFQSADRFGLAQLSGTVRPPRPFRPSHATKLAALLAR